MKSSQLKLLLGTAVLSLLAVALLAPAALAAPKEVAYQCGSDICLVDPDNPSAVVNLTFNGAASIDKEPVWSPDGTKLAFVATFANQLPAPTPNIYVMDPNAPGQTINVATQVTHYKEGNVPLAELAWSPDGSKIAFMRGNVNPGSQLLFVTESNGSQAQPLQIAFPAGHPTWSPDGSRIAYWTNNQIYVRNSDGSGAAMPLPGAAGIEPAWSPDGSRIAFGHPAHSGGFLDLNIVSSAGGTPTVVAANTQFIFAAWSPTGSQVAYRDTSALNGGFGYVRVANADGTADHGLPIVQGLEIRSRLSWSPDAARLVFDGFDVGDPGTTADDNYKVYVANSSGTGSVTSLTGVDSREPAWKPLPRVVQPPPPLPALPGAKIKPKLVWITKRIPWTGGYVEPMKVFCPVKDCLAKAEATAKAGGGARSPGGRPRLGPTAGASAKARTIVFARGQVKVPAGKRKPLKMKVTKKGAALIRAAGEVKLKVTVKIAIKGQETITKRKTIRLYIPKKK